MPALPLRRSAALALAFALASAPSPSLAQDETSGELAVEEVFPAEALFLADPLPPGSQDLNLVVALERGEDGEVVTSPALQLAAPLGERMGFTLDLGFPVTGGIDSPGASLKVLVRAATRERTGLSASLDLYGSLRREVDTEVAAAAGALRPVGPISLRATALAATGVSGWTPRLHAGVSAAVALSSRFIALAEVTADASRGGTVVSAGPTVKLALAESLSLMTGALFELGGPAMPLVTFQLTASR